MEKFTLKKNRFVVGLLIFIILLILNVAEVAGFDGLMSVNIALIGGIISVLITYYKQSCKS